LCHAMSIMATSGISPVGGLSGAQSGLLGEYILFLFMFFALSRLTFSTDTVARGFARLDRDPEFRIGLLIVFALPILLFLRHWVGTLEEGDTDTLQEAFRAFWGALFTVLSFLSTTGFESAEWDMAQSWSDLDSAGLILMGLALIGGGVATTAGGVKLLRVFALYLNGLHEMQRLVHPSAVIVELKKNQRIRKDGAFVAWIFFMLFALSLALITVILAATGVSFDQALVLSIASLSTTGPLIEAAAEHPIVLIELSTLAKSVLCAAMVLGRLETLAIIALFTPDLWRA
ncbi:MAG: potassium transporter TrkG, partial [Arenibacterium sp.]